MADERARLSFKVAVSPIAELTDATEIISQEPVAVPSTDLI
jgi:hypothetical protein